MFSEKFLIRVGYLPMIQVANQQGAYLAKCFNRMEECERNPEGPLRFRGEGRHRFRPFSALHSQLSNFQKSLPQLRKMERMPSYVGSRDLSRRIETHLQQSLPLKMRDPGDFMVTITLGKKSTS